MLDALDVLEDLIRVETIGHDERRLADYCAEILTDVGMSCEYLDFEPGREQLVATVGGPEPLTFTGHLDVVPVTRADWSTDPFDPVRQGDRIYGRGVSDMKAGCAAFLVAVAEHVKRAGAGRGIQIVLTSGEETGCTGALTMRSDQLRTGGPLVVAEPTDNRMLLGHKGALWLRLTAAGKAAHGSSPELGDNAIVRISRAAIALHEYTDWPAHDTFGQMTANVGVVSGGAQTNVVPDHAVVNLDMRSVPDADLDGVRRTVERLCGDQVTVVDDVVLPPVDTAAESDFAALVSAALGDVGLDPTPGPPARFFTDASVLSALLGNGTPVPTVILGPGEPAQAHVANEWCSIERLEQSVEVYRRILDRWQSA